MKTIDYFLITGIIVAVIYFAFKAVSVDTSKVDYRKVERHLDSLKHKVELLQDSIYMKDLEIKLIYQEYERYKELYNNIDVDRPDY